MNNEETIIMQSQNGKQNESTQPLTSEAPETSEVKDTAEATEAIKAPAPKKQKPAGSGHVALAASAAATVGGVVGSAGAAAAVHYLDEENSTSSSSSSSSSKDEEEKTAEAKVETEEEALVAQNATETADVDYSNNNSVQRTSVDRNGELDYTGHNGADPVAQTSSAHVSPSNVYQASNECDASDDVCVSEDTECADGGDVEILGIYEATDDDGNQQEWAILTDGQEVGAVIDVDSDGMAEAAWVDENGDYEVQENEVYDISDRQISMSNYEEQYANQQGGGQCDGNGCGQDDALAYNSSDDNLDYNSNADVFDI